MAIYITADLHLSPLTQDLNAAFKAFVDTLSHNDILILSGDLFDFYVGPDPSDSSQILVREILAAATRRGVKCYFQHGNRDFLLNKKEARALHLGLLPDLYVIQTPSGPCLVLHGDSLCTNDTAYMKFKRMVEKPWLQWLFLHLPLTLRRKVALSIRKKSLEAERADPKVYGVVRKTLAEVVKRYRVQNVVHGHIHLLGKYVNEVPDLNIRLSLGAWGSTFSYVRVDRNGIAIAQKPLDTLLKGQSATGRPARRAVSPIENLYRRQV